ncbi:hypothetical protein DLM75_06005 [Leptospira stimsonii]|uniref:Uncharacterized protein n=1 Tax=Leptospira stimsonii TaxID=2202203 RepID=A0A396ZDY3_9LEPT|nr:hypothetical protein DLM75_06005 [Leptospira stimsonii]
MNFAEVIQNGFCRIRNSACNSSFIKDSFQSRKPQELIQKQNVVSEIFHAFTNFEKALYSFFSNLANRSFLENFTRTVSSPIPRIFSREKEIDFVFQKSSLWPFPKSENVGTPTRIGRRKSIKKSLNL